MNPARSHPVRQLLDACAAGHPPSRAEVDELVAEVCAGMTDKQAADWRDAFVLAGKAAVKHRSEGANRDARLAAEEHAARLVAVLPSDDWAADDGDKEKFDPQAVADAVRASRTY
jgi:hypothetical protein